MAVVPGLGGTGKSRFAVELCRQMSEHHKWVAGAMSGVGSAAQAVAELPLPRLVVMDYAEAEAPSNVHELLSRLEIAATDVAPGRVALLTRDPDHLADINAAPTRGSYLPSTAPGSTLLAGGDRAQRHSPRSRDESVR